MTEPSLIRELTNFELTETPARLDSLLGNWGIPGSPSNRFHQYGRLLRQWNGGRFSRLPTNDEWRLLQIAILELFQLHEVLLAPPKTLYPWRMRLAISRKGNILPHADTDYLARSAQFELFLLGLFSRADMHPDYSHDPDIAISASGTRFGVAAKRVNSQKKIIHNVIRGAEQIPPALAPGVVAVDISPLLLDLLPIPATIEVEVLYQRLVEYQSRIAGETWLRAKERLDRKRAAAIMLSTDLPCVNMGEGKIGVVACRSFLPILEESDPLLKPVRALAEQMNPLLGTK